MEGFTVKYPKSSFKVPFYISICNQPISQTLVALNKPLLSKNYGYFRTVYNLTN